MSNNPLDIPQPHLTPATLILVDRVPLPVNKNSFFRHLTWCHRVFILIIFLIEFILFFRVMCREILKFPWEISFPVWPPNAHLVGTIEI
jgi:hypothetical protein